MDHRLRRFRLYVFNSVFVFRKRFVGLRGSGVYRRRGKLVRLSENNDTYGFARYPDDVAFRDNEPLERLYGTVYLSAVLSDAVYRNIQPEKSGVVSERRRNGLFRRDNHIDAAYLDSVLFPAKADFEFELGRRS